MRGAILIVVVMILAALQGVGVAAPASTTALVVGHPLDPTSLSPEQTSVASHETVFTHILERLLTFADDASTVRPSLAESWAWVDSTTIELRLKRGVAFSNGEAFDAEAAKYSMDLLAMPGPHAIYIPRGVYKETVVVDRYTIRIRLTRPYAPYVAVIARGGFVIPPKYHQQVGKVRFGQQPIGTGPFVLREWVRDSRIVLERNPAYWGGPSAAQRITFKIIPEETARVAALEAGEIDLVYDVPATALSRLRRNGDVTVYTTPGLRKFFVQFETNRGPTPLADHRVRIALNLAVDKLAIINSIFDGQAQPLLGQYMLPNEPGYTPYVKMYPYDPAKAKELLARAGYPNGFEMQLTTTLGRYALDSELGQAVVSYLQQVGIKVKHDALEFGAFVRRRDANILSNNLVGNLAPPEPHFNYLRNVKGAPRAQFEFPDRYDELVEAAAAETDKKKREAIYHRLAILVNSNPNWIFLHAPNDIYAASKRVTGFQPRADQVLWLYRVGKAR